MPWTDRPGPAPERSEGERYAAVQQRAAAIRRRAADRADDRPSELRVVGLPSARHVLRHGEPRLPLAARRLHLRLSQEGGARDSADA